MKEDGSEAAHPASLRKNEALQLERSRRDKMAEFYTVLQSMVPNLFPRATRTRVVDETISYIKSLEGVVTALDSQKRAKKLHRRRNSSITITVSNRTAFFALRVAPGHGRFARVIEVFEKHKAEVLAATVVASEDGCTDVTVTALLDGEESAERIKAELMTL
ncbi:uncharacterized protein A4U43_C02F20620 [Asparagus officinalis]|uniref:BHLH domain-containing protein n=1 Tax=Asparagus officinalis TaxID=4686 RepID=A0A5P1FPJ4_ASPOF|nr:uncharacterized protein LOC109829676 isoform X1 [Asparagus officinalis]ONK78611.1 uncharacterized protein A4U43_C02F20620 [Asparagus officinalis]